MHAPSMLTLVQDCCNHLRPTHSASCYDRDLCMSPCSNFASCPLTVGSSNISDDPSVSGGRRPSSRILCPKFCLSAPGLLHYPFLLTTSSPPLFLAQPTLLQSGTTSSLGQTSIFRGSRAVTGIEYATSSCPSFASWGLVSSHIPQTLSSAFSASLKRSSIIHRVRENSLGHHRMEPALRCL